MYNKVQQLTVSQARAIDALFVEKMLADEGYELDCEVYNPAALAEDKKLRTGQLVLAYHRDYEIERNSHFYICKVTSIKPNFLGSFDVRVANNQFSWRESNVALLPSTIPAPVVVREPAVAETQPEPVVDAAPAGQLSDRVRAVYDAHKGDKSNYAIAKIAAAKLGITVANANYYVMKIVKAPD